MKGAIPIEKRTISGRIAAKHSLPHNNRDYQGLSRAYPSQPSGAGVPRGHFPNRQ